MNSLRHELENPRYEVLPFKNLDSQLEYLPESATLTVTCSPNKGQDATLDLAERLAENHVVVPHLAARAIQSSRHLDEIISRMSEADIREAFIVGGDGKESLGPYGGSLELIEAIRERDEKMRLGTTAYPEGHPEIDAQVLQQDLLAKQTFDLSYVATQLSFNPQKIDKWVNTAQDYGLDTPVKIGIPGAIERAKLMRIAGSIGAVDATKFVRKNMAMLKQFFSPRGYTPDKLVDKLGVQIDNPDSMIDGFHTFTFNQIKQTEVWRQRKLR